MTYGGRFGPVLLPECPECPGGRDEFIVFALYFPEYQVFIEAAGGVFRLIPADIEEFQIDFDRFEETLNEKTKAVLINSPNNPFRSRIFRGDDP